VSEKKCRNFVRIESIHVDVEFREKGSLSKVTPNKIERQQEASEISFSESFIRPGGGSRALREKKEILQVCLEDNLTLGRKLS